VPQITTKNKHFLALNNLPNLKHCLSSNKVKQLKEQNDDNPKITNQQVLKTEQMYGSTQNLYKQSKYLPLNYNDSMKMKQLLNTKHMLKTLKQYNVHK